MNIAHVYLSNPKTKITVPLEPEVSSGLQLSTDEDSVNIPKRFF